MPPCSLTANFFVLIGWKIPSTSYSVMRDW